MSWKKKLVVLFVEIVLFSVSIFTPNRTTLFGALITMVLTILWTFETKQESFISKLGVGFYYLIAYPAMMAALFLGFTGYINQIKAGEFEFCFYDDVAFLGGISFEYLEIIKVGVSVMLVLWLGDLINFEVERRKRKKIGGGV